MDEDDFEDVGAYFFDVAFFCCAAEDWDSVGHGGDELVGDGCADGDEVFFFVGVFGS